MAELWLWFYDLAWRGLACLLQSMSWVFPRLRPQIEGRRLLDMNLSNLARKREGYSHSILFFCSSAGEYEQAKPLMSRLQKQQDTFLALIFVSNSGKRFALSQGEDVPFVMAPWDRPKIWKTLFSLLKPSATIVVRYELWPGFLRVAQSVCPLYLIDAVSSPKLERRGPAQYLRKQLVNHFTRIFVVGPTDCQFFTKCLGQSHSKVLIVGDTKYDRVLERRQLREQQRLDLRAQLALFLGNSRFVIILGSAWPADLEVLLSVYPQLLKSYPDHKLIVAPHDISESMVAGLLQQLQKFDLKVCRAQQAGLAAAQADDRVLLVDRVGILPELYGLADVAWVGGAMHYRVHNVLEPASQGLFVCCGPQFQTSQEAKQLVDAGLIKVVSTGQEFLDWLEGIDWQEKPPHRKLYEAIVQRQGASDRILSIIQADLQRGISWQNGEAFTKPFDLDIDNAGV